MSLTLLDRRALLRGGMTVAGCLALAGLPPEAAAATARDAIVPVTGGVIGWLVVSRTGSAQLVILQVDLAGRPVRQIETVAIPGVTSLAQAARHAQAAAIQAVAASWQVGATDCICRSGRIACREGAQSVALTIWTDFVEAA